MANAIDRIMDTDPTLLNLTDVAELVAWIRETRVSAGNRPPKKDEGPKPTYNLMAALRQSGAIPAKPAEAPLKRRI